MARGTTSASRSGPLRHGLHPLSRLVRRAVAPGFQAQGFAAAEVLIRWPEIVGVDVASVCQPERLSGGRAGGTLIIRAAGAAALELQHRAPQVIDRVNHYFGYPAVQRLKLIQAPLLPARRPAPPERRALTAAESAAIAGAVGATRDPGLREALARLGAGIAAKDRAAPS